MFTVNYDKSGNIVSYQGGVDASDNVCPDGCSSMSFATDIPGFFGVNDQPTMKVDIVNNLLVFINPVTIPAPISVSSLELDTAVGASS